MVHCRGVVPAGLIILSMAASSAPGHALTLKEALATAYATNPQLEAQRANLRATDEEVAKANARLRPNLSITGTDGFQNLVTEKPLYSESNRSQLSGSVTLSEPLFRGGRTIAEIRHARALVRAGRAVLTGTEQNVLMDGVTAYMDVARDTEILALRRDYVDTLTDQLAATRSQFIAGAVTQTDVSQTEARLESARASLLLAEGQRDASRSRFERVIGRPAETLEAAPATPEIPASLEDAVGIAIANSPVLVAAKENATAANYAINDAIGALMPQVTLSLQYQYSKNATVLGVVNPNVTQLGASAFVQLTVPLYQGESTAQVRQARQQYSQAMYNVSDTERQVRQAIAASWRLYQTTSMAIRANEARIAAARMALNGVIQEQRAGERAVLDILNAQQELLGGQVDLATARHDATVMAYQLVAATGALTARSLALDVKLYDPEAHFDRAARAWFSLGLLERPSAE